MSDPEVMLLTGVEPTKNLEETTEEFNRDLHSDWNFAIVLKVIGRIKFHRAMRRFYGEIMDDLCYCILREDYEQLQS